jgi:hypothetical protein
VKKKTRAKDDGGKGKEKAGKEPLDKLMKLTKLMKDEKVVVAPRGIPRGGNKWRTAEPKFVEKPRKAAETVQAGGMEVDPARAQEYENWRKDKIEEQNYHRAQAMRKARAAALERKRMLEAIGEPDEKPAEAPVAESPEEQPAKKTNPETPAEPEQRDD